MRYSQGFNPVPKASFSPALPVGTESLEEYIDIDLVEPIENEECFLQNLNEQLPDGITVGSVEAIVVTKGAAGKKYLAGYKINFCRALSDSEKRKLADFMEKESFSIEKIRKGKKRHIDVRKHVEQLNITDQDSLEIKLVSEEGKATARPLEILGAILDLNDEELVDFQVRKLSNKIL
jgi:radical SAM-linked protein